MRQNPFFLPPAAKVLSPSGHYQSPFCIAARPFTSFDHWETRLTRPSPRAVLSTKRRRCVCVPENVYMQECTPTYQNKMEIGAVDPYDRRRRPGRLEGGRARWPSCVLDFTPCPRHHPSFTLSSNGGGGLVSAVLCDQGGNQ